MCSITVAHPCPSRRNRGLRTPDIRPAPERKGYSERQGFPEGEDFSERQGFPECEGFLCATAALSGRAFLDGESCWGWVVLRVLKPLDPMPRQHTLLRPTVDKRPSPARMSQEYREILHKKMRRDPQVSAMSVTPVLSPVP